MKGGTSTNKVGVFVMQKIRFINNDLEYNVSLKSVDNRIVCAFNSLEDAKSAPITNGFYEINEDNGMIQGDYTQYKYVYNKVDDITFVLTMDKNDVYVEPVTPEPYEPEPYVPTEEEIAEQERQRKIAEINSQINTLKSQLSDTDYIFVKCYEASLVGQIVDEYDFESLHKERQSIRKQINELETELETI